MRAHVTRRGFIQGALGTATVAALGAAPRVARAAPSEIREPIVIDDAWVRAHGSTLQDREIRVSDDFESGGANAVIWIRTSGVTLRNLKIIGHPDLGAYPERWQQGIRRKDGHPGVHQTLKAVYAASVDGLTVQNVAISGFPVEAMRLDNVSNVLIEDYAFHHVFSGLTIKDRRGYSSHVTLRRVRGTSLWQPHDEPAKTNSLLSREGHGGNTGGNGLALRNVRNLRIEDYEMIGDQATSAKLNGCSNVIIRRFVGGTLQITSTGTMPHARYVLIEDSELSRMNEFGAGACTKGRNMLMLPGAVEIALVRRCRILGGKSMWNSDASALALDDHGESLWRRGHGIQLASGDRGEFDPRQVSIEGCVFMGHNGRRGRSESAALHNCVDDGTADQSERLMGGLTAFFANNDFVDQQHLVLTHDGSYID